MAGVDKRDPLPQRAARGKRMAAALDDEEDAADTQFWNQEFFAEDAVDNDYVSEEEPEDIIDSDFDDEEEAENDEDVEVRDDEPRKKSIKPPGRQAVKPKPKPKPKAKPKDEDEDEEPDEEEEGDDEEDEEGERPTPARKPKKEPIAYVAPTLRRSTVVRVAEAKMERQYKAKPVRRRATGSNANWRPLTQQELLAEAALNEIENTRSLKALLAREEETKRRAQIVKKKNLGPIIKFRSKKNALGEERTTLELINTVYPPKWMAPSRAPTPPEPPICAITGLPARYIDPHTRAPLANTLAFKRLRTGAGPLALSLQQQLVMHHNMEEAQRQAGPRGQGQAQQGPRGQGQAQQGPALLEQLRAQRQRREQLAEQARAIAAAAVGDSRIPDVLPQGTVTTDLMAMLVDVHRSLAAA